MEPRLTEWDRNEALIYLGFRGGPLPEDLELSLERCRTLLRETARPRLVWRRFALLPGGALAGADFCPPGEDVKELLKDCRELVLMAATLGAEIETLLRRTQLRDMGLAMVLDACASAAIENVCDNFCEDLAKDAAPLYLTDRFSPGYGDLPLSCQADFFRLLDIRRRIGVSLSPAGLMIPQKSVTALIGLADRPQKMRSKGCAVCSLFDSCRFRREGVSCGKN